MVTATAVAGKGGVKAISMDYNTDIVLAKPSPWFKELYVDLVDNNYSPHSSTVVWTMPNKGSAAAYCPYPDYDMTSNCKLNFEDLGPIWFYKIRFFLIPPLSY